MKKTMLILSAFIALSLASCKKCGTCYETFSNGEKTGVSAEVCSNEAENDYRAEVARYNAFNGTAFGVVCDR
jgi:hypothetical protein